MESDRIIQRCGRFTLAQSERGFCWELHTPAGEHWYWNPATRLFTGACRFSPTQEEAVAGLEGALARELGTDLNPDSGSPRRSVPAY